LSLLVFGVILVLVLASLTFSGWQVEKSTRQEKIAAEIAQGANELRYLAEDYLINGERRQLERWQSRFAGLTEKVAALIPEGGEQQEIVRNIQEHQRRLKEVFDTLLRRTSKIDRTSINPVFLQAFWSRITIQSHALASDASSLLQILRASTDRSKRTNLLVVVFMFGIFAAFFLIIHFIILHRTLKSIAKLQAGTVVVGSGNLDFVIEEKENDEIGELSRSFNRMTADLKTVTASKSDLEREIAERKRVEDSLRRSQAMLDRAEKIANVGSWEWDIGSGELKWSGQTYDIMGLEAGKYNPTHDSFLDRIHPEDRPNFERSLEDALSGVKSYDLEYRIITPELSTKWVHARGEVIFDESGRTDRMTGSVADITDRKRAEEAVIADLKALTRMHALSGKILEVGGIEPLLQEIMDAAVDIMAAERGTLHLLEGNSLRIVAHHGHGRPYLDFFASPENKASICAEAMTRRERIVVPDIEKSPFLEGTASLDIMRGAGVRAVQSTPMISRTGAPLGVLTTHWEVPYTPDEHDLWRIDLLARQAADLIDRMKVEEALRKSEEEYRLIVEHAPTGIYEIAYDGPRLKRVNNAMCLVLGYTREELLQMNPFDLLAEESKALFRERICKVLAGAKVDESVSFRVFARNGREIWALFNIKLMYEDGVPTGALVVAHDITEHKRIEEALRESEEKFRGLSEASPAAVIVCRGDGNLYVNPAAASILGYTREELLEMDFLDIFHPDYREVVQRHVLAGMQEKADQARYEVKVITRNGREKWLDLSSNPIRYEGLPAGIVICMDITERKKAEQKIRESEARLRESNARLKYLTNRMEEIREEERAAIARELHDELGQVLTGFRMDLSWLLKQLPQNREDLIRKTQFMMSYIDPAIQLIRRISTELRPGILDDLGLVATIEWQLQVFRNRTGIDCDFDSHIDESELDGRLKTALFRVIQESMTNIIKHAEATAVRISLVMNNGDLNLKIEDNGKGIRQHDLRKKSSTGIRGIEERIAAFEGKLDVRGAPGKGTVLDIVIPVGKES